MPDAKKPGMKFSVDDLFTGGGQLLKEPQVGQVVQLNIAELHDFPNHPFKVRDDETMRRQIESIREYGVLSPILVRPRQDGGYEIISGHRRKFASIANDLTTIPAIIGNYTDDEAIILMVDSNIQREDLLPSERAFAYKMKLDAMKRLAGRPGKNNSGQVGQNLKGKTTVQIIGEQNNESTKQVQRFIRLTNLIPELLDMVDEKRIAFNPAVELSYLKESEQRELLELIGVEEATPSLSQAQRLKQLSQAGKLDIGATLAILTEQKPNQREVFKIKHNDLVQHIPKSVKPEGYQKFVLEACDYYTKHLEKQRTQNAR